MAGINKVVTDANILYRHVKLKGSGDLENPTMTDLIRFSTKHRVPPINQ